MPLQLIPDGAGDPRNARYFITAADLAYLPESEGKPAFKDKLGLDAKLVCVDNTQAYVGTDEANVVVAFRGSESPGSLDGFKDWLVTNADNFLILPEGTIGADFAAAGVGARFHRGFLAALAEIWDPLFAAVNAAMDEKDRLLWVTGHSLGGALALVGAWRLRQQFLEVHQVYTFGAPMVGNETAARAFEKNFSGRIFRYIDECDMVPKLPTMSLLANDYFHCVTEVVLSGTGKTAAALLAELGGVGEWAEGVWGKLKGGISAHLTGNYLARIEEKCKDVG